ncbi:MAG: molybdate ABC transporter substrate-binding protein [Alphaproteobacteria bacterium]|nr:molybdate ABC transporter substrate-binding protein [Alphaproteobacteria bacterium]
MSQGPNPNVLVYLSGDQLAGLKIRGGYEKDSPDSLRADADRWSRQAGIPYLFLARPGTHGSSGDLAQRRRPREGRLVDAALQAFKARYAIGTFHLAGQSGGGMTGPLKELAAQFEGTTGHKLVIRFGTTPELIKLATTGGPFDMAVVPREVLKDEAAQARVVPGPTIDVARVGLGVAVRAGAAKPDVATAEALKQTLLKAQSVATVPASAAGAQVLRVFDRLGIGEAMKTKTRALAGPAEMVKAVAAGEAELGVFLINVLTTPGLDVVGPVPVELNQEIVFTAAIAADAKEAEAAKAFIAFLKTPGARAPIQAKGMIPG